MPINPASLQAIAPSREHGALAAARIPFVPLNDTAALQQAATAAGFQAVSASEYTHGDGSWLVMVQGRLERGVGAHRFASIPKDVRLLPQAAPGTFAHTAAAGMNASLPPAGLAAFTGDLTRKGFSELVPGYFAHADGSWVAVIDGQVTRGAGDQTLAPTEVASAAPAQAAAQTGAAQSYPVYTSLPSNNWYDWRARFAIAKLPRADGSYGIYTQAELTRILNHLGLTSADGVNFSHPDGTHVTAENGRITSTRFQQWTFGQLPYSVNVHWNQWDADTKAWNAWVKGQGPAPF